MRTCAVVVFLFTSIFCSAQSDRQVNNRSLVWAGFYGQYNINAAWNINLDMQARYEYTDGDWTTWLIRPAVTWKAKNHVQLTAGIALFALYQNPNSLPPRPEWRPWQEIGKKFVIGHHTIYPRFRFEQRFIKQYGVPVFEDNFSFNTYRSRVRCDYIYTFDPTMTKGFNVFTGDEYMVNTNPEGKFNFDQNRAWLGLGYKVNKNITLQLSYLNFFLRRNKTQFEQQHIARFTLQLQLTGKPKPVQNKSEGS